MAPPLLHLRLPVAVALVVLASTLFVAARLRSAQEHALYDATRDALVRVESSIERRLGEQRGALVRLARRWERRGAVSEAEFAAEAQQLIGDFGHLQAVEWADPDLRVRWIIPLAGNEGAQDLDLGFEERRRVALDEARRSRTVVATRPIDLVQGGKGFLLYVPLFPRDEFGGFLLGVSPGSTSRCVWRTTAAEWTKRRSDASSSPSSRRSSPAGASGWQPSKGSQGATEG